MTLEKDQVVSLLGPPQNSLLLPEHNMLQEEGSEAKVDQARNSLPQ